MLLVAFDETTVSQYIPAMSIADMLKNTPHHFSQHCLPPLSDRLLYEAGERQSYEIDVFASTQPEDIYGWRMADIRETLWLWIWNERFQKFRIGKKMLRTSSNYELPCESHLRTSLPVLVVDLADTTVRVRAEYPSAIDMDLATSFWLRPNPWPRSASNWGRYLSRHYFAPRQARGFFI